MIGKKILETRKSKGLSQEQLSEQSKINVRTLQRIESGESTPRGKTLELLCDALGLDRHDLFQETQDAKDYATKIADVFFIALINVAIMCFFGYLTLDSGANLNSKTGAFVLSFFLPYYIVKRTPQLSSGKRVVKFGSGLMLYLILVFVMHACPIGLMTGFYPSILIALTFLYYGNSLWKES